jgi:hypothetical protein
MRILGPVTEDEVIACFLRAELTSERYGQKLRTLLARDRMAIDVLVRPDLGDPEANRYRRTLLDEHRAFERREGLFADFPKHIDWHRAALEPEEVLEIRYINWDWWLRISGGTRSAVEAAKRIRRGEVAGVSADEDAQIAAALRSRTPPPELIAVSLPERSPLVLVEGHVRLTAYALFPEFLPDELEIYLGIAEDMAAWSEF